MAAVVKRGRPAFGSDACLQEERQGHSCFYFFLLYYRVRTSISSTPFDGSWDKIDPERLQAALFEPLADLVAGQPDNAVLHARSVLAAFRARRIKAGSCANYKVNFSPSTRIR